MKKSQIPSKPSDDQPIVRESRAADAMNGTAWPDSSAPAAEPPADEPMLEGPPTEELEDPTLIWQENLAIREKELAEVSDKYLRLAAEYDNFRKRSQKEKETLYNDSIALVIREWLPVVDNLDRAIIAAGEVQSEESQRILAGIQMIQKQAAEAMNRLNVTEIDCLGQTFDPQVAEAVMHVEDDDVGPSTVVAVLQKGYRRDEKIIRHSIVKVAN